MLFFLGIRCGLNQEELSSVAPQHETSLWWTAYYSFFGSKTYTTLREAFRLLMFILVMIPGALFKSRPKLFREKMTTAYGFFSKDKMRTGEASSANVHASARGLAAMGAMLADKGRAPSVGGSKKRLISEDTWKKMHGHVKKAADGVLFGKNW